MWFWVGRLGVHCRLSITNRFGRRFHWNFFFLLLALCFVSLPALVPGTAGHCVAAAEQGDTAAATDDSNNDTDEDEHEAKLVAVNKSEVACILFVVWVRFGAAMT